MLVVKDLELFLGDASGVSEYVASAKSGGGSASFGPFSIGGSYSSAKSSREFHYESDRQRIRVPGMQVIGFKCHVMPKSPNPLPSITKWV
jgi:hypothetical protein